MIYQSIKVEKNKYRVPRPKRRFSINVSDKLCICFHKGRWIVALTHDERWESHFFANQTINRTQALKLIGFLSDYVNLIKPTEATFLNATIKASANRIIKNANDLTGKAVKIESEGKE